MSPQRKVEETYTSVVLTDWAAFPENMGTSPEATLYQLLLLSLLYDEILIQDEIFALSDKLAQWFTQDVYSELLTKCFDLGSVVILKHPLSAYPEERLRELALKAPIFARADYVRRYGTRAEHRFRPTARQLALYRVIDSCLATHPKAQRPVGSLQKFDIMATFASILKEVLSSRDYDNWRHSAFRRITDYMAEDFVGFIEEPERVVERCAAAGRPANVVTDASGRPTFNRSLAFQAARLYPKPQREAMKHLVQTTFAAPFAWREKAAGRYGGRLRELLWVPSGTQTEIEPVWVSPGSQAEINRARGEKERVSVEACVDIPLHLPDLNEDFVEAVASVRDSEAGKRLRLAIRQLGADLDFSSQIETWYEVADLLASAVARPKRINIRTSAIRIGREMIVGSVADLLVKAMTGQQPTAPEIVATAFMSGAVGVVFDHGLELMRNDLHRQEVRQHLERAVDFRCSRIAVPSAVVGA